MAHLILPRRYAQQPATPTLVDLAHPLAQGLFDGVAPASMTSYGGVNIFGDAVTMATKGDSYAPLKMGVDGLQIGPNGGNLSVGVSTYPRTGSGTEFTLFGRLVYASATAEFFAIAPYGYGYLSRGDGTTAGFHARFRLVGESVITSKVSSGSLTAGQIYSVALSFVPNGLICLYIDGELAGSASAGTGLVSQTGNTSNTVFRSADGYSLAMMYKRALSDVEVRELSRNPWQIFRTTPRRIHFDVAAGGGATQPLDASGAAIASGSAVVTFGVALAGVGVALAGGSAAASGSGTLAASGTADATGAAAQSVEIALSALGLAVAGGTAALGTVTSGDLSASGSVTVAGSATLTADVTISASGLAQAAGSAGLSAAVLIAGSGAALAAGNAALAADLRLLAMGAAQAGGGATLSSGSAGSLDAAGGGAADGSAALALTVRLAAAGGAQASGGAALSAGGSGDLEAAGAASSAGTGLLTVNVTLTAAGFVQAMGAGYLVVQVALEAAGNAVTGGAAVLTEGSSLVLISMARWMVNAAGRQWVVNATGRSWEVRA